MKNLKEFSGQIKYISASPHGDPEGVVLENGTFIKTPPHSVLEPDTIKVGLKVYGSGELINSEPNEVFHHVLLKTKDTILANDQDDKKPKIAKSETKPSKFSGKLVSIATKPKGEVDRMIFEDGTSIHLSKELELFAEDMLIGRTYKVTGELKKFDGFAFCRAESVEASRD